MKKCTYCGLEKNLSEFYGHRTAKDGLQTRCKKCFLECQYSRQKEKSKADPEYRKKLNKKVTVRRQRKYDSNPVYRFRKNLSRELRRQIQNGYSDNTTYFQILGGSWEFVRNYIESLFSEGMSWDNQGQWHLDHIVPLSIATNEEQIKRLCHYTNIQPLWAKDNINKADKIPEGYQIPF